MGLTAYLRALERVAARPGIPLGLAGHEDAMHDVYARIGELRASHLGRLDQTLRACERPRTLTDVAALTHSNMRQGAPLLLAIQSAATRVEHLLQEGRLERLEGRVPRFVRR